MFYNNLNFDSSSGGDDEHETDHQIERIQLFDALAQHRAAHLNWSEMDQPKEGADVSFSLQDPRRFRWDVR